MVIAFSMLPAVLWTLALAVRHLNSVHAIVRSEPFQLALGANGDVTEVSPVDLFPFAVSLQLLDGTAQTRHFCGGTYLNKGWILTAAHCVISINYTQIVAQIGGLDLNDDATAERYPVVEMHILRTYNPITMVGDIALLRVAMAKEMAYTSDNHTSLRLPQRTDRTAVNGEMCYIFGYGSEAYDGPISQKLRYGTVLALEEDNCIGMMGAVVAPPPNSGMFCAIGRSDACKGDSGGGYVCRVPSSFGPFVLRGVISYGVGCGAVGTPGVYTDVAYYLHHFQPESVFVAA